MLWPQYWPNWVLILKLLTSSHPSFAHAKLTIDGESPTPKNMMFLLAHHKATQFHQSSQCSILLSSSTLIFLARSYKEQDVNCLFYVDDGCFFTCSLSMKTNIQRLSLSLHALTDFFLKIGITIEPSKIELKLNILQLTMWQPHNVNFSTKNNLLFSLIITKSNH